MSKRQFKSQASSAGAAFGGFGSGGFRSNQSSVLSYIQEPPDYASISDANVVVAFKNLSKKDGTTKAKALEDIQTYITSLSEEPQEPVLEVWTKLFPRLTIDGVRRVRQLAHNINGQICAKCGKRSARHLPRIAGPWLAGTFDVDRAVARAASEGLDLVFSSHEKIQGVRKTFQKSILEYCRDALLHETIQTLSDERVVNAEDAAATYARTVSSCLSLVGSMIKELPQDDREKVLETYQQIFSEATLWDFVHHTDAGVRRSMHRLVQTCLEKQSSLLRDNINAVSTAYVYKGLHSDQTGSALDFTQTLVALTSFMPVIWTEAYSGKRPAASRLRYFLKQGSQSSSVGYWDYLSNLLRILPTEVLPTSPEDISELLFAGLKGVSKKEERFNASSSWPAYFTLVDKIMSSVRPTEAESILDAHAMPVIRHYLNPSSETAEWSISTSKSAWIVSRACAIHGMTSSMSNEWPSYGDKLIETAKMSQPEQSKEFDKSQMHVAAAGERWADLHRELWASNTKPVQSIQEVLISANTRILGECIDLLKTRNGKPYGAAAIIEQLLRTCAGYLMPAKDFREVFISFAKTDMQKLIFSPAQRQLVHASFAVNFDEQFQDIFSRLLESVLDSDEPFGAKLKALRTMLTSTTPAEALKVSREMPKLQRFVLESIQNGAKEGSIDVLADMVKLNAVPPETADEVLGSLVGSLRISDDAGDALQCLDVLSRTTEHTVKAFTSKERGQELLPNLLLLEQSPEDDISQQAERLYSRLSSAITDGTSDTKFNLVLQNLEKVSEASLPMDTLHELVMRLLGSERTISAPSDVLPSTDMWLSAIRAITRSPKPSLALMSTLGGAIHLVENDSSHQHEAVKYDIDRYSQAMRISMYMVKLLVETDLQQRLGDMEPMVMAFLHISALLAEDNVSIAGTNRFWMTEGDREGESAAIEFIDQANNVLGAYWKTLDPGTAEDSTSGYCQFHSALEKLQEGEDDHSPLSYYVALSYTKAQENLFEIHGYSSQQVNACEVILKSYRTSKDPLKLVKCISGLRQPLSGTQSLNRLCNELIADLTGLEVTSNERKALEQLILLNTILNTQEDALAAVAKQRLIFLVKHIQSWLDAAVPDSIRAETCKALTVLLPPMQDIYGEHWDQVISALVTHWTGEAADNDKKGSDENQILLTHATLKLAGTLRRLSQVEEPNDDLVDALKGQADRMREGLIEVLKAANGMNDEMHQPLKLTHELLGRQIVSLPYKELKDSEDLYPLLYTPSNPIQHATFDLLHKQIPASQEQISFDAALENKTAHLPDELLSLLLETPTLDSLADASFDRTMPLSLQGYLYSWRLLFDHFDGSSYRVKNDYIEQLKDGAYLAGLLGLVFDFLGHTRGRPIDAAKFDIQNYVPDTEPSPEKDVQWLLTHLYYLALTHLPSLVKSYYLDIRSRQTSAAIESWTAKHLSPIIITASLKAVAEWSETSVKEDPEYEKMTVKVGMRSKEINVSYLVDEQTMAIKVVLPDAYPLASAQVVGVSRVAVKEEKWQSWLRNCQGVITFSNGSITDGLAAWRRNVTGALKGQTECAICYSIISADKQLPTKRCPTCKNMFHSGCLFKWFKTSNASTCPLCRNPFSFN